MKLARILLSLSFLTFCFVPAQAQKEDWLPITQHDLDVKQVPNNPGADALQLYYADYIRDDANYEFIYRRIKILNEKGNRHADVEIGLSPEVSMSGLKARTIHPDGKIIEYTGKPFQKVIVKGRGIKILAKTFTMPDVTVGSIIEYRYRLDTEGIFIDNSWTVQHDLYTEKESFLMIPFTGDLDGFPVGFRVAAIYSHMPSNIKPAQKGARYELETENVPAFEAEGYMPPENDFKYQVRFFYVQRDVSDVNRFWSDTGKDWNQQAERFIGNHREVSQAATEAIGSETNPEQKLRKLYARAQQIRNLSYERDRTEDELKKENLKSNQNVADVITRGKGYSNQITYLFVAMARAAGFDANIVRTSDRRVKFFDKGVLSGRQLEFAIADVNVGGTEVFLDPGTRFCPYGFLHWTRSSAAGLKLDKKGGTFINVPGATYEKALTRRVADAVLDAEGNLKGTLTVKFEGGEALEHRLDALENDEAGRKKSLEDEVETWLPTGSDAKMSKAEGWEAIDEPLVVTFNIEVPSYSSAAGKRLLMPAYLFQSKQMDAFKHSDRKFPVYFPYAFGELDRVNITLPPGFSLESVPKQQEAHLGYAAYQNVVQFDGVKVVTQRILQMNGIYFDLKQYGEVKDFFGKVQAADEEQAVLSGGNVNAQKGN